MGIVGVASASGAVAGGVDDAARSDAGARVGDVGVRLQRLVVVVFGCVMFVCGVSAAGVLAFLSLLVLSVGVRLAMLGKLLRDNATHG